MKPILPAALLLGAAALSPLAVGLSARHNLSDYAAAIEDMPGYSAEIERYDMGYLGARATLRLRFVEPELQQALAAYPAGAPPAPFMRLLEEGLLLDIDIAHGPLVLDGPPRLAFYRAGIAFAGDGADTAIGQPWSLSDLGLEATLDMGLGGDGILVLSSPAVELDDGLVALDFGGMEIVNRLSGYGAAYETEGSVQGLSLNVEGRRLSLDPIAIRGSGDLSQGLQLATSEWTVDMSRLEAVGPEVDLRMENLHMQSSIADSGESALDMRYGFSLGSFSEARMEAPLRNAAATFSASGIDKQALLELYEALDGIGATGSQQEAQALMLPLLGRLLGEGTVFRIERLGFEVGDEVFFESSGSLRLGAGAGAVGGNPLVAVGAMNASADLAFSRGFLDWAMELYLRAQFAQLNMGEAEMDLLVEQQRPQFDATFAQLVQAGYLNFDGSRYTLSASFSQGQLTINGAVLPMPLL